ncbi:MAG: hypothetical protein ACNA8W_05145 [Bradymonadaceae bacterium]
MNPYLPGHIRWALGLFVVVCAVLANASCSLLVKFEECAVDGDCSATGRCMDGICYEAQRVEITDHIVEDTTWTADNVYVLANLAMIVAPATLTIEPGTIILGRRNTGLVSLAGAKLEAVGTREQPIVFTSDKPEGQRLAGDWAGVAMVGRARVNRDPFNLRIITDVHDTSVGGNDDTWNCGTLRYVRVEFGGSLVDGQKALNGVTLAGCGSGTTVEYVQSHMSDDDGIAVFGGTVDLRYIVSTRARDDGLDLDVGWRGTAQFIAVQQDVLGVEAIELENLAEDPSAIPQSDGQIYNFTLIGANREGDRQLGLYVKLGGLGTFSHGIIMGQKSGGLYIDGAESAAHGAEGLIEVRNTLFYDIGPDGESYFGNADLGDRDEAVFEDYAVFEDTGLNNLFGKDPGLSDPYNLSNPGWVPAPTHTTGRDIEPPPEPFDPTAVYRGAFSPSAVPWTEGWTAYPRN